jgi:hypothetical protein
MRAAGRIPVVGLRDLKKRLTTAPSELHNEELRDRFVLPGATKIAELPLRQPVRVAGEIKRIRTVPRSGVPALEIVVCDGTGDAIAVFTGRRSVGGLEHGRGVLIEGVAHDEHGRRVILNPAYTLLPSAS